MDKSIKKIKKINKNLFKTINYVHKKTDYLRLFLFLDIIWCFIRYGVTFREYRLFEFYRLDSSRRSTYISKRTYKRLKRKLVDDKILNVLTDKSLFLRRFNEYIPRTIYNINDISFKKFEELSLINKKIISRSTHGSFISTYKEYDMKKYRGPGFVLEEIKNNKHLLVESVISQHRILDEINKLVLVNIVSVCNYSSVDLVTSSIKYKVNGKIITGSVDVNGKCIVGHFKDESGNDYGDNYEGLEIPYYNEMKELAVALAHELDEIRQVEWSFMVGSAGDIYLMDANIWTDYVFAQMPEFLNRREGLLSYYKRYL